MNSLQKGDLSPIHNIAEICARKKVRNAILCPGSRSAALTISMVRHPEIETYSISDERSAGFIGLGMAQITGETVALVCTSGTAALNFAPSVAEAFFQELPLLVLTADRPPEWIHQYDGQTIYQKDVFGKHVKKSFELPSDYTIKDADWQIERILNEAINLTQTSPKGPVHINIPIREPFYPVDNEEVTFDRNVRIVENVKAEKKLSKEFWQQFREVWQDSEKKLIVVGHRQSSELNETLYKISEEFSIPVVGDIISNLDKSINADVFLFSKNEEFLNSLKPNFLITCGKSIISKNLKLFIRNYKPRYHFHIQENAELIDTFQTLTHKVEVSPEYFFNQLFEDLDFLKFKEGEEEEDETYFQNWQQANLKAKIQLNQFLKNIEFCEFKAVQMVLENLPENSIFHVANSMPVRYSNLIGLEIGQNSKSRTIEVFANRGTSGIDGSLSSAVGSALKTEKNVTCLIGDMSFFYDRNAFWNSYLPDNLRVIVLNNHGGNIFKILDGPNRQPEVEEYFATKQTFSAKSTAIDAGFGFSKANTEKELNTVLNEFYLKSDKAKLIEIELNGNENPKVFAEYKQLFAEFS